MTVEQEGGTYVGSVILPEGSAEILTDWACAPATNARMRAEAIFMMIE
jgi:hypothetical protein